MAEIPCLLNWAQCQDLSWEACCDCYSTAINANTHEATRLPTDIETPDDAGSDDDGVPSVSAGGGASVDEAACVDFTPAGHASNIPAGRSLSGLQPIM